MIFGIMFYSLSIILFVNSDHSLQNMSGASGLLSHLGFLTISATSAARVNKFGSIRISCKD